MTPEEAIKIVKSKAGGRTRYEGQEPYLDEVLVAEIERLREASEWRPIETAPKDGGAHILLYGSCTQQTQDLQLPKLPIAFSGYWDTLDEAWCSTASTWLGPFFDPTHWMPLPEPPEDK